MCPDTWQGGQAIATLAYPWWMWVQWKVGEGDMGGSVPSQTLVAHQLTCMPCWWGCKVQIRGVWWKKCRFHETYSCPTTPQTYGYSVYPYPLWVWVWCQGCWPVPYLRLCGTLTLSSRGDFVAHHLHPPHLLSKQVPGDFINHHPLCSPYKHEGSLQPMLLNKWQGTLSPTSTPSTLQMSTRSFCHPPVPPPPLHSPNECEGFLQHTIPL